MKPTNELAIQKYFRTPSGSVDFNTLQTSFGINAIRHPKYNNLVLFKYDQIMSPMGEAIVQDCRGIILDEQDNWSVVAMAFRKFFNHGEFHCPKIDWATAAVQEKLDGTLCLLYAYDQRWHVATTGTPDAGGSVAHGSTHTFAQYFWDTFRDSGMVLPDADCGACFFFELMGPENRVVVRHPAARLAVLGCRRLPSLEEEPAAAAAALLQCPTPDLVVRGVAEESARAHAARTISWKTRQLQHRLSASLLSRLIGRHGEVFRRNRARVSPG